MTRSCSTMATRYGASSAKRLSTSAMFKGAVSGDFGPRPYHRDGLARMASGSEPFSVVGVLLPGCTFGRVDVRVNWLEGLICALTLFGLFVLAVHASG